MTRRFIVCTNNTSVDQRNAITKHFRDRELPYWHWFQDVWLILDSNDKYTAASLRDEIGECSNKVHCLVFRLQNDSGWAAFGTKKAFVWLKKYWKKNSEDI